MENSLNTYPNRQFNPIEIPDFTLVEVYKESVAPENGLGYFIVPIKGLSQQEIEDEIDSRAGLKKPSGYDKYILLTGADGEFNHKIVYAVWYKGDVPQYPTEPEVSTLTPAEPLNIWQELEVNNEAAPSFVTVTLTCSAFDNTLEFYINDDYFAIDIKKPIANENQVTISKEGVSYAGKPIDSFKMTSAPKLKAGVNYIKVKSIGITNVGIKYRMKY